ncbi:MAG: helix-turn-helix domain-containing protein [Candidatus Eisenbacteria bacterium]|nr:helix-turn-helix domain-containing protein [Candidatus Eisenbacteria bacterium]
MERDLLKTMSGVVMGNAEIAELRKSKDSWDETKGEAIAMTARRMNVKESRVRLGLEQGSRKRALGLALKYARQRKRISVKKMAERFKVKPRDIERLESEKIANFPLGLIIVYLNELGYILSFDVTDF